MASECLLSLCLELSYLDIGAYRKRKSLDFQGELLVCAVKSLFSVGFEPVVHPKGHIMVRIEDLFFRSAVVREGDVVGDS